MINTLQARAVVLELMKRLEVARLAIIGCKLPPQSRSLSLILLLLNHIGAYTSLIATFLK